MKWVRPDEAHALMDGAGHLYLDVRSVPEFEGGHPRGAFNVPFLSPTAEGMCETPNFVRQVERHLGRRAHIIVGCLARTRSIQAAQRLIDAGFEHVCVQRGGMDGVRDAFGELEEPGWRALGLPVAYEAEEGRSFLGAFCQTAPKGSGSAAASGRPPRTEKC